MVGPPWRWRVINAVRAWIERDDRMLCDQWRAAFAPKPKPKVRHINLVVARQDAKIRRRA